MHLPCQRNTSDGSLPIKSLRFKTTRSISGLDFVTSISGAATSISNVGPGIGENIGPSGNFSQLSNSSKWILSLGMIMGRLEIFAILILFIPSFWRKY